MGPRNRSSRWTLNLSSLSFQPLPLAQSWAEQLFLRRTGVGGGDKRGISVASSEQRFKTFKVTYKEQFIIIPYFCNPISNPQNVRECGVGGVLGRDLGFHASPLTLRRPESTSLTAQIAAQNHAAYSFPLPKGSWLLQTLIHPQPTPTTASFILDSALPPRGVRPATARTTDLQFSPLSPTLPAPSFSIPEGDSRGPP